MWLFGQVWFACLVGFAVGVALDWVVRVKPLSRRIAELEAQLAAADRKLGQDGDGARRSVFDRGFGAEPDADGFVTERNRGGLLMPSNDPTMLTNDIRPEPAGPSALDGPPTTVVSTGVDDFPGVARLSGAWDTDRTEAVPPPHVPSWEDAAGAPEAWQPAAA